MNIIKLQKKTEKMKKNYKIFIAGHNGMVGKSLVNFFKSKNFDNLILVSRKQLNLENFKKVNLFLRKKKPDVIINCAGRVGGIMANYNFPTEFLNENILIQTNLIKCAHENNIKHFINLGSSCIYPKNSKQPIKEDYLLTDSLEETNEAYALAKIIGVKLCEYYNRQFKRNYFTLMPCNLYGPHDNFNLKNSHFVPALIKKIILSKINKDPNIEIWGTGKPKREVMFVDDLARAIFFILNKKIKKDKKLLSVLKKTSLINVGSGKEYLIKDIAKIICKLENNKTRLYFNTNYPDGTKRKVVDTRVLKNLGWSSKVSLAEGLSKTIKWYKKNYL
jgi:GDP-L-fucose synthase